MFSINSGQNTPAQDLIQSPKLLRWRRFFVLLPLLVVCASIQLGAQKYGVQGKVLDENASPSPSVTVLVLSLPDSIPVKFALTDTLGIFNISDLKAGSYRLLCSYLGYSPLSKDFELGGKQKKVDFGVLKMAPDPHLLKEVQISAKANPIMIHKDTVIYRAESFATREHAAVLELLKKLPGLEIGSDGTIRANGKVVENILVDGKKFFQDDQQTTTKVLPANAIERVEVYDQRSVQATFSGVDDGQKEKTINLVLKEDRKKGWFGEATAAGGGSEVSNKRYEFGLNANRFSPKHQYSVLGNVSNLSPGQGAGGFSRSSSAGLNYNRNNENGKSFYSNYQFGMDTSKVNQEVSRQVFLPEGTLHTTEKNRSENLALTHNFSASLSNFKDTTSTFALNFSGNYGAGHQLSKDSSQSFNSLAQPLNAGARQNESHLNNDAIFVDLVYGKRLNAAGRNITLSSSYNRNANRVFSETMSENSFFSNGGVLDHTDRLDQEMNQKDHSNGLNINTDFTEPLGKKLLLQANLNYNLMKQLTDIEVNDLINREKQRNDSLSSIFNNQLGSFGIGTTLQFNSEKWSLSGALLAQNSFLSGQQRDIKGRPPVKRNYWNLLPRFNVNWQFDENQSLNLDYGTNISQPSITQLQPVPDRSDPLNIQEGNPDLKPEYVHQASMGYQYFDADKGSGFFINGVLGYAQNRIIESIVVDANFIRHFRPQNSPGELRAGINVNFNQSLEKIKSRFSIDLGNDYSKGQVLLSERINSTETRGFRETFTWNFFPKEWVQLDLNATFSQNELRYSIEQNFDQTYQNSSYNASLNFILPHHFSINSSLNVNVNRGRSEGFNQTIPIWNMEVSRQFLKSERLTVALSASDLLNRNIGLSRSVELNYLEDRKSPTLSRYFLLRMSYLLQAI